MTAVTPIAEVSARDVARVTGRVVAVQVEANDVAPAFTIRLEDGSGRLEAVFMGRREIPGLAPGVTVTVEGRVCETVSIPRVYNPRYELAPVA